MAEAMSIENKLQQMADMGEGGKRSAEENATNQNNKRPRGEGPKVSLRLLIPSKSAGAVIGKGGANINRLRSEYKATITVPDCSGPERILTVTTELEDCLDCIRDVIPSLEENKQHGDKNCDVRILVHQSLAGAIIGKSGSKIKELREQTEAAIKVYSEVCPNSTDRVVQVGGTPDKVSDALRELQKLIDVTPIKGPSQSYDPYCSTEFFASSYGGYTSDNMRGGPGGMGPHMRPPMGHRGARFGGGGGSRGGMGGFDYMGGGGQRGGFNRGQFGSPPGHGGLGRRGGGRGGQIREPLDLGFNYHKDSGNQGALGGGGFESLESTERTTQVTIPKDYAGAIIGARGTRIRQIRSQSGAKIKIDEAKPDSNDRIITITGTDEQINNAQLLLQESVRQNSGAKYY